MGYLPPYCCNLDGVLRSLLVLVVVMVVVMGAFYGELNCLVLPRLLAASEDYVSGKTVDASCLMVGLLAPWPNFPK
jgi:hypothetical protein